MGQQLAGVASLFSVALYSERDGSIRMVVCTLFGIVSYYLHLF